MDCFRYITIPLSSETWRTQTKEIANDKLLNSVLLFVSSRHHYQAEF